MPKSQKFLGFGLGLRTQHYQDILNKRPAVDWFEAISEDYIVDGGNPIYYLQKVRENYPVVLHGVSLSIGSTDPLDKNYLQKLKKLIDWVEPEWVSDHLCWTGVAGINLHDLMPLPFTEEALNHIVTRVKQVQDYLGRQIALENVSSYVQFIQSEFNEWDFLNKVAELADCKILLDINNIYVNSFNHGFSAETYIQNIHPERVQQFHLAGHTHRGDVIIDTHDAPIIPAVWELYEMALKRFGKVATLIERDDNIPPLEELVEELNIARKIAAKLEKKPIKRSKKTPVCPN